MADISHGIEAIRRFQVLFNDLAGLADALEGVSNLQRLADAEASRAHDAAQAVVKAKAELAEVEAHMSQVIADAEAASEARIAEAMAKATEIIAEAQDRRTKTEDDHLSAIAKLEAQTNDALTKLESLNAQVSVASMKLAETEAQIAALKAAAAAVLG